MPDVASGSSSSSTSIRGDYQAFTQDWLSSRNRVTYTSDGERQVTKGPDTLLYDDAAALGMMNNLKVYEGAVDELKRDMYWAGFYGDKSPSVGGDIFDDSDLAALDQAMKTADWQGGIDVIDLVTTMSATGRARNAPLGQEVDQQDDPSYVLSQFAKSNGITLSDDFMSSRVGAMGAGTTTLDKELTKIRNKFVKGAYPAWADEIDSGQTIDDIASPYKSAMSQILGIPESQIDLTDTTLRSALQAVDVNGKSTYKPLWMFEKELRKDPRWQYTDNAYSSVRSASQGALNEMGFK